MAATIIQFPQTHSNIFLNLTQLINLASDNQVVEEYAEIMAVCHEEGNFKPGEVETLQEQIRARRLLPVSFLLPPESSLQFYYPLP